jgi:hypothetical protein
MRSRIRFYNRQGIPLDEVDADTIRSWLLNEVGECTFVIGKRNPKLLKYLIEFGNFILVTNEHTSPWVGVIDLPRAWTRRGPRVTAYSAEHILKKRYDQVNDPVTSLLKLPVTLTGTAGELFTQIVNLANVPEDTILEAARIFKDGVTRQETLKSDYLTHIKNISLRSGQDFDVRYSLSATNQLSLQANWYSRKGQTRGIALEEGVNIRLNDEVMIEQGEIINSVVAIGSGSVDSSRLAAVAKSPASIRQYGLREGVVTYSTVTELPTLQNNADVFVRQNAYPRLTARITCTEQEIFDQMETGDVLPLILHTAGFLGSDVLGLRTTTRILGLQAFDQTGTLDVLVDEFTEGD